MKLGIAYNVFDGIELLEYSLNSIRGFASYIVVIYSVVSNNFQVMKVDLPEVLSRLQQLGLIDHLVLYTPDIAIGLHANELNKRNLGLDYCRLQGCTHFLSMDVDELYKADQFQNSMRLLEENGADTSVCGLATYYKKPYYRFLPDECYYVPFIMEIFSHRVLVFNESFPVLVDPTRCCATENCLVFERDILEMHHFSYVRKDLRTKLICSSAMEDVPLDVDAYMEFFDTWKLGEPIRMPYNPDICPEAILVDNIFKIEIN